MKRISFNHRFINAAGDDLIAGKIHTIRQNYEYWKRFEEREVALFTWEGKPYQKGSKQKVFCVKKIISVQQISVGGYYFECEDRFIDPVIFAKNDGFNHGYELCDWFSIDKRKSGEMAILHFTDFRY